VILRNGTVSLGENRTNVGSPALDVRGATVSVDGAGRTVAGPWAAVGEGVDATNASVDALTLRDLRLVRWRTGVTVADADEVRIAEVDVGVTHRGLVARNVSTVTVADTRLVASTAGAFHGVGTVRLRNVTTGTHGTLVFDDGTRAEASNVALHDRAPVDFTAHDVAVDGTARVPSSPANRTRVGPALDVTPTGSDARLTVTLPTRRPPGTPASTVSVWRYDGGEGKGNGTWRALPTTRTDDGVRATLTPEGSTVTVTALGAAEPHLASPRSTKPVSATVGDVTRVRVGVRNVGTAPLAVTDVRITGANASSFSIVAKPAAPFATGGANAPAGPDAEATRGTNATAPTNGTTWTRGNATSIPPGATHFVGVAFAPESPGPKRAALAFEPVGADDPTTVSIVGEATAPTDETPTNGGDSGSDGGGSGDDGGDDEGDGHGEDGDEPDGHDVTETDDESGDHDVAENDGDDTDDRIIREKNGRRLLRMGENLWLVLNPRRTDAPPPTKGTDAPPGIGVPTVTVTPSATPTNGTPSPTPATPDRTTTEREHATATATASDTGPAGASGGDSGDVPTPATPTVEATPAPPESETTETLTETPVRLPGFGLVPALVALAGVLVALWRRH
jgi:hypothetical protein